MDSNDEYEIIYDSGSEISHTLQGIEVLTLKAALTTPDGSNAPQPDTITVTLPRELVENILLFLDTGSILTCRLVNREFDETIQSSTLLQYFLACKVAGVIDNPQSLLSYSERLEALKKREDAWRELKPVFEMTISVNHQTPSQICRSTEGVYFLTDDNEKDLNYCHLTSFSQDNPRWIRIPGHGPALDWSGILVNFVTALYEHDLIVNLISSDTGNQADTETHSLDLVLLKFSTGGYHPLARCPQIHVQISFEAEPWVSSAIVGDHLALIVHSQLEDGTFSDKLFIFDWKTGRKRLEHEATGNAYSDLVFISPELLLVTNCVLSLFEVWHIHAQQLSPQPPIQILSLQMPAISPEYCIFEFGCHGEPNPIHHSTPYLPPRPLFSSPENSIMMFTLRLLSNPRRLASYNLIMHRRALLDTIQTWSSHSLLEQQEYLPRWLMNEVTVHEIADLEDGSIQLDTQSKLVSTMPHPRSRDFPTLATSSTFQCTFLQVPWEEWGPPISRWFKANEPQARWLSRSNGQRCAFSEPSPFDRKKLVVSVADFNPHHLGRNASMMARFQIGKCEEKEFEILDHEGAFLGKVYMGLKCVVHRAPDEYDFDVVSMDEQRVLGFKLNREGHVESIKVLYIG